MRHSNDQQLEARVITTRVAVIETKIEMRDKVVYIRPEEEPKEN